MISYTVKAESLIYLKSPINEVVEILREKFQHRTCHDHMVNSWTPVEELKDIVIILYIEFSYSRFPIKKDSHFNVLGFYLVNWV